MATCYGAMGGRDSCLLSMAGATSSPPQPSSHPLCSLAGHHACVEGQGVSSESQEQLLTY